MEVSECPEEVRAHFMADSAEVETGQRKCARFLDWNVESELWQIYRTCARMYTTATDLSVRTGLDFNFTLVTDKSNTKKWQLVLSWHLTQLQLNIAWMKEMYSLHYSLILNTHSNGSIYLYCHESHKFSIFIFLPQ